MNTQTVHNGVQYTIPVRTNFYTTTGLTSVSIIRANDLGLWIFFRGSSESRLMVVEGIHIPTRKYPFVWRFLAFKLFVVLFWKLVK